MKADYRHTLNRLMEFFERLQGALMITQGNSKSAARSLLINLGTDVDEDLSL